MARVTRLVESRKENQRVHDVVDCTYSVFVDSRGSKILQLDTYGRSERKLPGKVSQSLQFDEVGGKALLRLLAEVFDSPRGR